MPVSCGPAYRACKIQQDGGHSCKVLRSVWCWGSYCQEQELVCRAPRPPFLSGVIGVCLRHQPLAKSRSKNRATFKCLRGKNRGAPRNIYCHTQVHEVRVQVFWGMPFAFPKPRPITDEEDLQCGCRGYGSRVCSMHGKCSKGVYFSTKKNVAAYTLLLSEFRIT